MTRKELNALTLKASAAIRNNPISDSEVKQAAASAVTRLYQLGLYK